MLSATREATVVHVYNTGIKSKASTVIERSRVLSTEQGAEFPEGEANGSTCSRTNITKARCHSRQLKKRRMCVQPQHSGTSCEPLTVSKTRLQRPTRVTPKTESGTPPRHQADASLENQRHSKRRRGSDGEYTEPTTTAALLGDIDSLTDTPTSRPNTKRCIQVGSETYVIFGQRRPDSLAIDWINKMVYVLEFKRTSAMIKGETIVKKGKHAQRFSMTC